MQGHSTLKELLTQLRADHPRLIVLVGERHASAETRKHFAAMAKNADVGFFEAPNRTGDPQGETLTPATLDEYIAHRHSNLGSAASNKAYTKALFAPKYPVLVDTTEPPPNITPIREAIFRHYQQGTPASDPAYTALRKEFFTLSRQRLKASNGQMAEHMANHLDAKFPGNKPFFAIALLGDGHIGTPPQFETQGTQHDITHALTQRGYTTVTIGFTPMARTHPRQQPGHYQIKTQAEVPGFDYTVEVVDPPALSSPRQLGRA